jgi:NAD(P)-dependent dehydrogenase (short-subunit alcohol dehydrogenase family)
MGRFEGRVALVSGAASGIGAAVAARLEQEGATVVRGDLVETDGGVLCDVSDARSCADAVHAVLSEHGGLHVLANVAGIGFSRRIGDVTEGSSC